MDGMNSPAAQATFPPLSRRRFTSAEVERMVETGIITKEDHVELLGGELIEMGKQGARYWDAVSRIMNWLMRRLPEQVTLVSQGPLRLADGEEPEPDIFLFPTGMSVSDVRGPDTLLVIEIADSSLDKDRLIKAPLYAAHGVREYWIVDLENRVTLVHRLAEDAYAEVTSRSFEDALSIAGVAELLVLSSLVQ